MNNLYRGTSSRRRPPSGGAVGTALRGVALVGAAIGIFVLAVMWFRDEAEETPDETVVLSDVAMDAAATPQMLLAVAEKETAPEVITLSALGGVTASGSATKTHASGVFAITAVVQLPAIDTTTTAYEVWFVKPGITDFFSLGELYPREDGAWGFTWQITDALARPDILDFHRLLITREERNGNPAPSANQVLQGEFK